VGGGKFYTHLQLFALAIAIADELWANRRFINICICNSNRYSQN